MGRSRVGLVAAVATLLAALPLSTLHQQWTWLTRCAIAVCAVVVAAAVARRLRAPVWGQVGVGSIALSVVLTAWHRSGDEVFGILPTHRTVGRFVELLAAAPATIREVAIPVGDREELLFLTTLVVGSAAIWVDACAVVLRRPDFAGLPMLAIYAVPVFASPHDLPVAPFVAGASGFLWLLGADHVDRVRRFGQRITGDGRPVDVWAPTILAGAGRRLAFVGVLAAVALPFAVPPIPGGLLDGGPPARRGRAGGPVGVDMLALLDRGISERDNVALLRLTTTGRPPAFLRIGVAEQLSVDGFRNGAPSGGALGPALVDPRHSPAPGATYTAGHARIEILALDIPLLPVVSEPVRVRGLSGDWRYDPATAVVFSNRARTRAQDYEVDFVRVTHTPEALRSARPQPRQSLTAVPPMPEVDALVARLVDDDWAPYDKMVALRDYFASSRFTYSRRPNIATGRDALLSFLDGRTGYCAQYAAALAWLARAAGIPARVAIGFTTDGPTSEAGTRTLAATNLHAWTEASFDGFGWVPFDATPATARGVPEPSSAASSPITGVGPGGKPILTESPGPEQSPPVVDAPPVSRWRPGLLLGILVALTLAAAVFASPAAIRVRLRRLRRAGAGSDRCAAHAAWAEFLDTLVDLGLPGDPRQTPRRTVDLLAGGTGLARTALSRARLLATAEERARYARTPLPSDELAAALDAVRTALTRGARRRTRVAALLLPRSVLRRLQLSRAVAAPPRTPW